MTIWQKRYEKKTSIKCWHFIFETAPAAVVHLTNHRCVVITPKTIDSVCPKKRVKWQSVFSFFFVFDFCLIINWKENDQQIQQPIITTQMNWILLTISFQVFKIKQKHIPYHNECVEIGLFLKQILKDYRTFCNRDTY